jgi:hypothetical protein
MIAPNLQGMSDDAVGTGISLFHITCSLLKGGVAGVSPAEGDSVRREAAGARGRLGRLRPPPLTDLRTGLWSLARDGERYDTRGNAEVL